MDLGIQGRRALVLGASRGLGRGIAEVLAAEGCNLILSPATPMRWSRLLRPSRPRTASM